MVVVGDPLVGLTAHMTRPGCTNLSLIRTYLTPPYVMVLHQWDVVEVFGRHLSEMSKKSQDAGVKGGTRAQAQLRRSGM